MISIYIKQSSKSCLILKMSAPYESNRPHSSWEIWLGQSWQATLKKVGLLGQGVKRLYYPSLDIPKNLLRFSILSMFGVFFK